MGKKQQKVTEAETREDDRNHSADLSTSAIGSDDEASQKEHDVEKEPKKMKKKKEEKKKKRSKTVEDDDKESKTQRNKEKKKRKKDSEYDEENEEKKQDDEEVKKKKSKKDDKKKRRREEDDEKHEEDANQSEQQQNASVRVPVPDTATASTTAGANATSVAATATSVPTDYNKVQQHQKRLEFKGSQLREQNNQQQQQQQQTRGWYNQRGRYNNYNYNYNGDYHNPKKHFFQYGNYPSYYGYRHDEAGSDPRMLVMRPQWFEGRKCLDIGCNTGELTMELAKKFNCESMYGVDIDPGLIAKATRKLKSYTQDYYYYQIVQSVAGGEEDTNNNSNEQGDTKQGRILKYDALECLKDIKVPEPGYFPISCEITYGPLPLLSVLRQIHSDKSEEVKTKFPYNVTFQSDNYIKDMKTVLRHPSAAITKTMTETHDDGDNDDQEIQKKRKKEDLERRLRECPEPAEKYDTILCFSVTKWIHLNWGDEGVKYLFHKVYKSLNDNGVFILEPQPWKSYKKKHHISEKIKQVYQSIEFVPDQFDSYLINTVGFARSERLDFPADQKGKTSISKGFQRPIFVYYKTSNSNSSNSI